MDIALVSPSPKPFAVGGIEKLMLGIYSQIDTNTDQRVELIKLPTAERDFWDLIESYRQFYNLDLTHFDMVITFKYPAWMVQHKNHKIHMAHHLRGLFDTYHFLKLPTHQEYTGYKEVDCILDFIKQDSEYNCPNLNIFFDMIINLKKTNNIPQELFSFPGPFIKDIIHYLDGWALDYKRISEYNAISANVKKRENYFPQEAEVRVVYPPTTLINLTNGNYEYFLVVGRLDGAKRVELILEATKLIKDENFKLLIAGSGPEEKILKEIAKNDDRIEFIGYIDNLKLVSLYKDALAVIYIPYDEDYGLVTIEAMQCEKPVITCTDSGGTNEFVIHENTGLLAKPTAKALANEMGKLINDKNYAKKLGVNAKKKVEHINWENYVNEITSNNIIPKQKVTVFSTYPVFPRKHGGQIRIYNLYKALSKKYDVTILSINDSESYEKFDGNLKEVSILKSEKHRDLEWRIEKKIGIPVTDIVMERLVQESPKFIEKTKELIDESDILIASHPYLFHLIEPYTGSKKIIYDSHNVEYNLKKSMLPSENKEVKKLLDELFRLEERACNKSDIVLACSNDDKKMLVELYNLTTDNIFLIPNGVDTTINKFISQQERLEIKQKLNIENEKIVSFIGSWHKPNLEAVEEIFKIAPKLPDVKFLIMGSQCLAFKDRELPINIGLVGIVEEELKNLIYSVTDIAINPMINGSGTNLKIAEYFAQGVPVITTEIGVRGYPVEDSTHCLISDIKAIPDNLNKLLENQKLKNNMSHAAKDIIDKDFSWHKIGEKLLLII